MTPPRCPGPVTRRRFLQIGALSVGLGAIQPYRCSGPPTRGTEPPTSVILIWLPGGPPHMETYDMKPDAPAEYRGDFRPIQTTVPGHRRLRTPAAARQVADKLQPHPLDRPHVRRPRRRAQAVPHRPRPAQAGRLRQRLSRWSARWSPSCASGRGAGVPNYVAGTDPGRDGIDVFSFGSAYLGPATHPFTVAGDPSQPELPGPQPRPVRRRARAGSAERVDLLRRPRQPTVPGLTRRRRRRPTRLRKQALTLMTSDRARVAFDLTPRAAARPRALRHARLGPARPAGPPAGRGRGQLRDDGAWRTPTSPACRCPSDGTYNWDSHAVNCHIFDDAKVPPAALRPGRHRPDRRPVRPRPRPQACC